MWYNNFMELQEKLNDLYKIMDKVIYKTATLDDLKELCDIVVNRNPYYQERNVNIKFEVSDESNRGEYDFHTKTIYVSELYLNSFLNGEREITDLFITLFHELRHHIQDKVASIVRNLPENQKPNFTSKGLESAVAHVIKFPAKYDDKEIENFYKIFSPFADFKFNTQSNELEEKVDKLSFGLYLSMAHECDARSESVHETSFFLTNIFKHYTKKGIPIKEFAEKQIETLEDEDNHNAYYSELVDLTNDFFNINLSVDNLDAIIKRINDMSNTYIVSEYKTSSLTEKQKIHAQHLIFQEGCRQSIQMLFEKCSFKDLSAFLCFSLADNQQNQISKVKEDGSILFSQHSLFSEKLSNILFNKMTNATEEEKQLLSSQLLKTAKESSNSTIAKHYTRFMTHEDIIKLVGNSYTSPNHWNLDCKFLLSKFSPSNPKDVEAVKSIFDYYNKNFNPKLPKNADVKDYQKQINFSKYFKLKAQHLRPLMSRFGLTVEFEQIINRPYPAEFELYDAYNPTLENNQLQPNKNIDDIDTIEDDMLI